MITADELRSLRLAATLARVVPSVRVRIRTVGGGPVLTVARPPLPDEDHPVVAACAFHRAVARAHREHREGRQLQLLDLDGQRIAIDIGLAAPDRVLAGGIYRVIDASGWTHLFATALDLAETRAAVEEQLTDEPDPGAAEIAAATGGVRLGLHHDRDTGVTLVHANGPAGDNRQACTHREVLELVMARCAATELVAWAATQATPAPPPPQRRRES